MFRALKNKAAYLFGTLAVFIGTHPVLAEEKSSLSQVSAEQFSSKIITIAQSYMMPLGGAVVLIAIIIGGIKMLSAAYSPEKRKEAMGGLGYVLLGAILIGGSMFIAGLFWGVGSAFK